MSIIVKRYAGSGSRLRQYIADLMEDVATTSDLSDHAALRNNPHIVTAEQVGTYEASAVDALLLQKANLDHNQGWSTITSKPNTLAGFGITDGYTVSQVNGMVAQKLAIPSPLLATLSPGSVAGQLSLLTTLIQLIPVVNQILTSQTSQNTAIERINTILKNSGLAQP